jgi:tetratricopeptide (TPR) repeat protein
MKHTKGIKHMNHMNDMNHMDKHTRHSARMASSLLLALTLVAGTPLVAAKIMETTPAANQEDADFAAGKKAVERKDWKGAVESLNKALPRLPENADLHNLLGYSYRHLNDLDNSFRHYKEALRIDPKHRGAHEYIGQAYLKANQPDKAGEHLAQLEKLCGKNCEEYRDLAKAIANYNKQK